jgi:hypothetical protein
MIDRKTDIHIILKSDRKREIKEKNRNVLYLYKNVQKDKETEGERVVQTVMPKTQRVFLTGS